MIHIKNQFKKKELFPHIALALSSAIIVVAARGDLWLDEIWSLSFAQNASSIEEIFTRFKHDNNHILNTLFMYFLGHQSNLYIYRLLSVASGIGSIFLLGRIARQWGRIESFSAILISGFSYTLILYFSESRGYAPAIFFSLSAFTILRRNPTRFELKNILIFWTVLILGILSHATFVIVILSLLALSLLNESKNKSSFHKKILNLCTYYFIPMVCVAVIYFYFFKDIIVGGGPVYEKWDIIRRAANLSLGFPDLPFFGAASVIIFLIIFTIGIYFLHKEKQEEWIFFVVILVFAPALLVTITRPEFLYFRYFMVCLPFFYLLFSYVLGKLYRSGIIGSKWIVLSIIATLVMCQAQRILPLIQYGRGNYMSALQRISNDTDNHPVRIASDHDFRNKILITFYSQFFNNKNRFQYIDKEYWQKFQPEWFIVHSQNLNFQPSNSLTIPRIGKYRFIEKYGFSGISGWAWFVYRLDNVNF